MYHVAMPIAPDDERRDEKVDAVTALPHAADAVRITVVHVAEAGTDVTSVPAVADALDRLAAAGLAAETVRSEERPTEALLQVAADRDIDAICVAGRRATPAGKRRLGAGAQQVLLRADCPVLVTGDTGDAGAADHV
jgi:nucleotide-binding universal stress UspA family protein